MVGVVTLVLPNAIATQSEAVTIPITNITSCAEPTDMNCIVSVTATFPDGHRVDAVNTGASHTWDSHDFQQNVRTYTAEEWSVDGLKNSSGTNTIVTQIWYQAPDAGGGFGAMDLTIFGSLLDSPQEEIKSPLCETSNLMIPCRYPPQLEAGVRFTLVINSNLIQPSFTSGQVDGASFSQKVIPGGYQYTIGGAAIKIPVNLPDANGTSPGDFPQALDDRNYWHLYIVDARNNGQDWAAGKNCQTGNPIISSNAAVAGIPNFDPTTKQVTLQVSSPHLSADGVTPETGVFQAAIPFSGVECLWGVAPKDLAAQASFSITYADGTPASAILTTKLSKNTFYVSASGYHYSSPTLHFTFHAANTASPVAKSVTCIKGKMSKTVSGTICPVGYKKK